MYHMYVGVRAGGGIGDEIEDPAGDEFEVERIVFDITFFFFVIVILLAIIQGELGMLIGWKAEFETTRDKQGLHISHSKLIGGKHIPRRSRCLHVYKKEENAVSVWQIFKRWLGDSLASIQL